MNVLEDLGDVHLPCFSALPGICLLLSVLASCGSARSAQEGKSASTSPPLRTGSATQSQLPTTSCTVDGEEDAENTAEATPTSMRPIDNPNCQAEHSYQHDLLWRLGEADKLVVRLDGRDECKDAILSLGASATQELVSSIALRPEHVGGVADLSPDVLFEFYEGEKLLVIHECISAGAFRSYEWPGDVATTAASNLKIRDWFKRHAVPHECLWFWSRCGTK